MKKHPFFLVLMNIQENEESLWAIFVKTSSQKKPFLVWKHILVFIAFSPILYIFQLIPNNIFLITTTMISFVTCLNIIKSFKIDYKCATSINYSPESKSESHESIKQYTGLWKALMYIRQTSTVTRTMELW